MQYKCYVEQLYLSDPLPINRSIYTSKKQDKPFTYNLGVLLHRAQDETTSGRHDVLKVVAAAAMVRGAPEVESRRPRDRLSRRVLINMKLKQILLGISASQQQPDIVIHLLLTSTERHDNQKNKTLEIYKDIEPFLAHLISDNY